VSGLWCLASSKEQRTAHRRGTSRQPNQAVVLCHIKDRGPGYSARRFVLPPPPRSIFYERPPENPQGTHPLAMTYQRVSGIETVLVFDVYQGFGSWLALCTCTAAHCTGRPAAVPRGFDASWALGTDTPPVSSSHRASHIDCNPSTSPSVPPPAQ
jgi:hypothetical protein